MEKHRQRKRPAAGGKNGKTMESAARRDGGEKGESTAKKEKGSLWTLS